MGGYRPLKSGNFFLFTIFTQPFCDSQLVMQPAAYITWNIRYLIYIPPNEFKTHITIQIRPTLFAILSINFLNIGFTLKKKPNHQTYQTYKLTRRKSIRIFTLNTKSTVNQQTLYKWWPSSRCGSYVSWIWLWKHFKQKLVTKWSFSGKNMKNFVVSGILMNYCFFEFLFCCYYEARTFSLRKSECAFSLIIDFISNIVVDAMWCDESIANIYQGFVNWYYIN